MPAKNSSIGKKIGTTLRNIIFAANVFVMILLLLSMLAWVVSPSTTTAFAYLGLGFPFILWGNVLFFVFWIILMKWKFIIANVVVFLLSWSAISTYYPIHLGTDDVPEDCIKVLSYNVRSFNWEQGEKAKDNPIFDYILKTKADIICFQEFNASKKNGSKNVIPEKEIGKILKDYPYHSIVRFGNVHNTYAYGVACYSKFPITRTERISLPESIFNGSVAYELSVKGKSVTLINNHLESNRITAEDKKLYQDLINSKDKVTLDEVTRNIKARMGSAYLKREKQVDRIAEYIKNNKNSAIIVCGDFNDTPISYAYHKMKGDLTDAYAENGLGQGITYHENKFWFRIDFIMHSADFKSYNCTVDKVKFSDHYPISTYLQLQ